MQHEREEMTIKLKLLFIAMDLLTLLAYPIVIMYGKLRPSLKSRARVPSVNLLAAGSILPGN